MIPSEKGGAITPVTLHRWRREGRVAAIRRPGKKRDSWFLTSSEVERLRGELVPATALSPEIVFVSPTKREREGRKEMELFKEQFRSAGRRKRMGCP